MFLEEMIGFLINGYFLIKFINVFLCGFNFKNLKKRQKFIIVKGSCNSTI